MPDTFESWEQFAEQASARAAAAEERAKAAEARLNDPAALRARLKEIESEEAEARLEKMHSDSLAEIERIDREQRGGLVRSP